MNTTNMYTKYGLINMVNSNISSTSVSTDALAQQTKRTISLFELILNQKNGNATDGYRFDSLYAELILIETSTTYTLSNGENIYRNRIKRIIRQLFNPATSPNDFEELWSKLNLSELASFFSPYYVHMYKNQKVTSFMSQHKACLEEFISFAQMYSPTTNSQYSTDNLKILFSSLYFHDRLTHFTLKHPFL